MNLCKDFPQIMKNQKVLTLMKTSVKNNMQGSSQQKCMHEEKFDGFILNKRDQEMQKRIFFPKEKLFNLSNPYFEFRLKPDGSNDDSHLGNTKNSTAPLIVLISSYKGEEERQAMSLGIIKNQSDFTEASLRNGIENNGVNSPDESTEVSKKQLEAIQLMKPTDGKIVKKKRIHEDGEVEVSTLEECGPTKKKILSSIAKEFCVENPYLEYILKSENSNLNVSGISEEFCSNNRSSSLESKMNEKSKRRNKKSVDIFGNHFTAKHRNKFKVNCPHCTKKVAAPGFARHLTYCMRGSIRNRTR